MAVELARNHARDFIREAIRGSPGLADRKAARPDDYLNRTVERIMDELSSPGTVDYLLWFSVSCWVSC